MRFRQEVIDELAVFEQGKTFGCAVFGEFGARLLLRSRAIGDVMMSPHVRRSERRFVLSCCWHALELEPYVPRKWARGWGRAAEYL